MKKKTNHGYALRSLGQVSDAKVASVELHPRGCNSKYPQHPKMYG